MRGINNIFFTLEDKAKYPFSSDALEYIKEINFGLDDLESDYGEKILNRAVQRIKTSILRKNIETKLDEPDVEILSFPVSLFLIKIFNEQRLLYIYSIAESKRVGFLLRNESREKILYLASKTFGMNVEIAPREQNIFVIHFKDYLKYIPEIRDSWSLVNRRIFRGMVYVYKNEMSRLIEEAVKMWIIEKVNKMYVTFNGSFPKCVESFLREIESCWKKYSKKYYPSLTTGEISLDAFPPCISFLLEKIKAGKNLSHSERFAVATFLLSIGKDVDYVISLFRYLPDYNEEITRYQVEHLAGLRGSRIKYTTFNCNNMRMLDLCRENELCRYSNINHPLQYYYKYGLRKYATRRSNTKKSI